MIIDSSIWSNMMIDSIRVTICSSFVHILSLFSFLVLLLSADINVNMTLAKAILKEIGTHILQNFQFTAHGKWGSSSVFH